MTEEENNTNQTAKDNGQEEENPDFKVVMPKAKIVTMPEEEYKEQPDYLKIFVNFYIAQFDSDDLEIMDLYDKAHNMVDINKYLLNNIHFSRKNLINHVLQYHDYNFKSLLTEIAKDEDIDPENMKTYDDWEAWYEKRRSNIPGSLS